MATILLDSTVIIDVMRGSEPARDFLRAAFRTNDVRSITPVRTELLAGVRTNETPALQALFDLIDWQPITIEIADAAGAFAATYAPSHKIGTVDALLAAATVELGGTVATSNARDFPMFPDLQPPY